MLTIIADALMTATRQHPQGQTRKTGRPVHHMRDARRGEERYPFDAERFHDPW